VLIHARSSRGPAAARRPAAVCGSDDRSVRRPRIRCARRCDVRPQRPRSGIHAGRTRRGHPWSAAARHARRTCPDRARAARSAHRASGPAAAAATGLHPRHRSASACVDRTASTAGSRPRRRAGRHATVAG